MNAIKDVTLPLAYPNNAGTWVHEVSSIVYEPNGDPSQRWKLVWSTFLKINGNGQWEHSCMALKTAATPEGLINPPAVKLFTGFLYNSGNDFPISPTQPPIATPSAIQIDTAIPNLATCIVAEPGLMATSSAVYLSIQCEQFNDPENQNDNDRVIFLLKCASPCDMTKVSSWVFLGRLFNQSESVAVEPDYGGGYAAPALAEYQGSTYLIVTPSDVSTAVYRGCTVFKFQDLETASLVKVGNVPQVIRRIEGTKDSFRGACGYDQYSSASGVFLSELSSLDPIGEFQIFLSRIQIK